jgi:putative sigma-54 modulation protein
MRIEFTGRHAEVPQRLRDLAERKLAKLSRLLPGIIRAHVILGNDKHRQLAEVTIHSNGKDLTAAEVSTDLTASLIAAMDKLTRQAQRHRGRRREKKRRDPAARRVLPSRGDGREPGVRVIRVRRSFVKPMTVEEAILAIEDAADRPLVFRDAETEGVKVLYKRKDGQLGLLEPEV